MTQLPLFRVRSWNNGMSCMSFYILIDVNYIPSTGHIMLTKWRSYLTQIYLQALKHQAVYLMEPIRDAVVIYCHQLR